MPPNVKERYKSARVNVTRKNKPRVERSFTFGGAEIAATVASPKNFVFMVRNQTKIMPLTVTLPMTALGALTFDQRRLFGSQNRTRVFGSLSIDKRRLPASKLQSRGVPGYVAEWVIDTVVPGRGPLSLEDAAKVQDWASQIHSQTRRGRDRSQPALCWGKP